MFIFLLVFTLSFSQLFGMISFKDPQTNIFTFLSEEQNEKKTPLEKQSGKITIYKGITAADLLKTIQQLDEDSLVVGKGKKNHKSIPDLEVILKKIEFLANVFIVPAKKEYINFLKKVSAYENELSIRKKAYEKSCAKVNKAIRYFQHKIKEQNVEEKESEIISNQEDNKIKNIKKNIDKKKKTLNKLYLLQQMAYKIEGVCKNIHDLHFQKDSTFVFKDRKTVYSYIPKI